ncbi:2-nitropropane dioxygenase [Mycobacterium paraense]|uniref:Probable nitronate monooxygenase n=1 Tax=Mycobacterium paraense TaxID=767916 RepID=A0A1X2A5C1_9MYCO|nr:nitronate monooxygenase [Mycobacterium paraense]MCV7441953.1 nitronate monooxygenase [Mycobacterium paraense]ORW34163.1 2-nitropropane dioxygenase [Mycobacterium paraense]ORW37443.1 2-nitropropane dioxygenase [Mycobacterium paraense]ORW40674.1 2-nitropropane dioxygenase [Mycobacterium paraense]ORW40973.1 2-nitropropane dioxygenase [Mycobacterium paraense]
MVLGFWDIAVPIVGAPMAGGPGTPALAAAVSNAGGLGFIPGGYVSAERFAEDIAAARAMTTGPLGVNLFVPQPSVADWVALDYYADELEGIAEHYQCEVGRPEFGDDDDWERKLEVVLDVHPELVSFTFGVPPPDVIRRLSAQGLLVMVTVTSAYEAGVAVAAGADSLVVQGPDAGGHRGTFAPDMEPATDSLHDLIDRIHRAHRDVPIIAAGGLGTAEDVAGVLRRGAVAAQVGTALLLSNEAGTSQAHRTAMKNQLFAKTIVTRAFSGRYGRGLENEFIRLLDNVAPLGYPEVNQMTLPIREAATEREDPNGMALWAGTSFRQARTGSVADIVAGLSD